MTIKYLEILIGTEEERNLIFLERKNRLELKAFNNSVYSTMKNNSNQYNSIFILVFVGINALYIINKYYSINLLHLIIIERQ